jgi:hypothetical protein
VAQVSLITANGSGSQGAVRAERAPASGAIKLRHSPAVAPIPLGVELNRPP